MSLGSSTPDKERILAILVHVTRGLEEAVASRDKTALLLHGGYAQACEDMLAITIGEDYTRALFRSAKRAVETEAKYRPVNNG